jgi:flagellar biosynthesis protein FliQ
LHNEERELQIRLAQLQTDVQIFLSTLLGVSAIIVALIISLQELSTQATDSLHTLSYLITTIFLFAVLALATRYYNGKMWEKRKEMDELKKEYVW